MKFEAFKATNTDLLDLAFNVRRKVFIDEQKVAEYEEFDKYENDSIHFIAYNEGKGIGAARLRETKGGVKLERFAVLKEHRGQGIGNEILNMTLEVAKGYDRKVYLHAQVTAVDFYAKNGFVKTGEQFIECEILHYHMHLENSINNE